MYWTIKRLTGSDAKTSIGQMSLEAVFLELLIELVQPGSAVLPSFSRRDI